MKIRIICSTCSSDDVCRDAWAVWSVEKQKWVLGAVYDHGHCNKCEGDVTLKEVELPDDQAVLPLEAAPST